MNTLKKPYESPKIAELGSLHQLTQWQAPKVGTRCDVTCFHHGSTSPG